MEATITDLPTEAVRPDGEELQIIVEELTEAKKHLYGLRLVQTHEDTEVPAGGTLGTRLYGAHAERARSSRRSDGHKRPGVPFGEKLADDIAAAEIRVALAQSLYDGWNAREDAWVNAQPRPEKKDEAAA